MGRGGSFACDGLIEVQQDAGNARPCFGLTLSFSGKRSPPFGGEQLAEPPPFIRRRLAGGAEAERVIEPRVVIFDLTNDAGGQGPGHFVELLIIQEGERLQRRVRAQSAGAGAEGIRSIENGQGRVRGRARPKSCMTGSIQPL